jgi:hypothetical protein|tara:strand:+ start:572 stop:739 length:168 start_codon:yes stop_codon:yes gene_type:complete
MTELAVGGERAPPNPEIVNGRRCCKAGVGGKQNLRAFVTSARIVRGGLFYACLAA